MTDHVTPREFAELKEAVAGGNALILEKLKPLEAMAATVVEHEKTLNQATGAIRLLSWLYGALIALAGLVWRGRQA